MTEFGPNGSVINGGGSDTYTTGYIGNKRVRRIGLAVFLCGLCASFLVAVLGFLALVFFNVAIELFNLPPPHRSKMAEGFQIGAFLATFNWFLFFVTIPVASLVIWLSIGKMPARGVTHAQPYLKWSTIWGAVLVGATTTTFASFEGVQSGLGGFLAGVPIGAIAGFFCGALFLLIVRPNTQLNAKVIDAF